jgi:hypothetical protein
MDVRSEPNALASHAVGTVAIASAARRTNGTASREPDAPAGTPGGGTTSARNNDEESGCRNIALCLLRDLFGIHLDGDP